MDTMEPVSEAILNTLAQSESELSLEEIAGFSQEL